MLDGDVGESSGGVGLDGAGKDSFANPALAPVAAAALLAQLCGLLSSLPCVALPCCTGQPPVVLTGLQLDAAATVVAGVQAGKNDGVVAGD